ncbi:MAG TPA: VWA domain-containing protein, partial [Thermoanaerobaculia bacterium]
MTRRVSRLVLSLFLLDLLALPLRAQEGTQGWLDEVGSLITPREREVFLGLADEADRQAFIQRFWQVRDPYPETDRNEARERWEARLHDARRRWSDPRDDRARVFLVSGEPSSTFETRCAGAPLEVWAYEPRFQVKYLTMLVFTSDGKGHARLWHPGDAPDFVAAVRKECAGEPEMARTAMWVRLAGRDGYETIVKRALSAPKPREWVSSFTPPSTAVRRETVTLQARLDVAFPGRQGDGLVRVMVEPVVLPSDAAPVPGGRRELVVSGRILRGAETVDSFRYRFDSLPTAAGRGRPLAFERRLRPGLYKLKVELDSPALGRSFVGERELAVPAAGAPAAAPAPASAPSPAVAAADGPVPEISPELLNLFEEADSSLTAPRPGLRILAPGGKLLAGTQLFEARVDRAAGLPDTEQIERVAFSLDGHPVLTRNRPPYVAQLDLGQVPRPHRLSAEGLNRRGEILATDELVFNAGAQRFAVRLLEPEPGRTYRSSLRARAEVEAPEDRSVERVEFYLGDSRVATLYQPPFSQPLALPGEAQAGYVRAVAYLNDGTATEDLVLLNAPAATEKMHIRLVELYTNVVDGAGKPVEAVAPGEFQVFEDGVRQSVRLVERVQDTPLRLVTLIDNSASMQPRLEASRQAALQFLHRTLQPRDEAALITFNRSPHVAVGLTGNLAVLEEGLSGLVAEEETSLYDSLIFSLYYLGGTSGQRAVLLLSDGLDRTSAFRFEDALECARRAGIAVYAIGIDLPRSEASQRLARLAEETGGRSFFLHGTGELERAYQEIERDLRSRYRISYQSSNTRPGEAFRIVKVQVCRSGLEA